MTTIERGNGKTWTGLAVAWGCTVVATIALALVVATAPLPYLAAVDAAPAGSLVAPTLGDRDG